MLKFPLGMFLVVLIALASHFIVTFRHPDSLVELFAMPGYWVATAYTATVSILVAGIVWWVTKKLDVRVPWHSNSFGKRLVLQLILGIICPTVLIIVLASIYYAIHDIFIIDTGYFTKELPLILLMIIVLNGGYYFMYITYEVLPAIANNHKASTIMGVLNSSIL